MTTLAERIFQIRNGEKLSQAGFAQKLNLSQNFVWMVENGRREPSDRTIADICRVFGVDEVWLRTGVGEMSRRESRGPWPPSWVPPSPATPPLVTALSVPLPASPMKLSPSSRSSSWIPPRPSGRIPPRNKNSPLPKIF